MRLETIVRETKDHVVSHGTVPIQGSPEKANLISIAKGKNPSKVLICAPGYPGDAIEMLYALGKELVSDDIATVVIGYPGVSANVLSNGLGSNLDGVPYENGRFSFLQCDNAIKSTIGYVQDHTEAEIYLTGHSFGGLYTAHSLDSADLNDRIRTVFLVNPVVNLSILTDEFERGRLGTVVEFLQDAIENGKIIAIADVLMKELNKICEKPVIVTNGNELPVYVFRGNKDLYVPSNRQAYSIAKSLRGEGCIVNYSTFDTDHGFSKQEERAKLFAEIKQVIG